MAIPTSRRAPPKLRMEAALLPAVYRRPVRVLPGMHLARHPRGCPDIGLAAWAAWRRPFPHRRGSRAP